MACICVEGMKRRATDSSSIASLGYDAAVRRLEVEFTNHRVYQYFGVQESVYEHLLAAESRGQFFNHEIRDRYAYKRVR